MTRIIRFLAPIVIAIVLGPLIAGLALSLLAVGKNLVDLVGDAGTLPIALLFPWFGIYIIFAYIYGGAIAFLAGLLVSIWMLWRPPSGMIVTAAAAIATIGYLSVAALGFLGAEELTNARSNFWLTLVLAVIAAAGCWLLTRRLLRRSSHA